MGRPVGCGLCWSFLIGLSWEKCHSWDGLLNMCSILPKKNISDIMKIQNEYIKNTNKNTISFLCSLKEIREEEKRLIRYNKLRKKENT